ncbi:MAG: peptidoglycan DD-metalloendopeptidase family protein [Bacteroidota bacterium]
MSKVKFYFNTKTLKYEKVQMRVWDRVKQVLSYVAAGLVFASISIFLAYTYLDSPKEKQLKRNIEELSYNYEVLNGKLNQLNYVLEDLQKRDDNIYRAIFEAEPIPDEIRKAGFGGADRYKQLENLTNSDLILESTQKLDRIAKQMYIQSKSFDDVIKLVKNKEQLMKAIPSIQPIDNKDLKRLASGFGWRTHPIYKITKFHTGLDFTASVGTPIYAASDAVVETADAEARGYGNHVVLDHGYGYKTLYGHMSRFAVRAGQKVKRGDIIGYVGNTGTSSGPHLHYEVIKNGDKIDPINFFASDLSPEDYAAMLEMSEINNQSFD